MKINIKIECETINEFYAHLCELKKQIKKSVKKQKLNALEDEFKAGDAKALNDNNCYGTHTVKIIPEI